MLPSMAKRPKRGNDEGSAPRKRADGRWESRYTIQTAKGAKRKSVYAKTRAECARALTQALSERDRGISLEPSTLTFGEHLARWLEDSARHSVKPSTYIRYEGIIRNHLVPALGHVKLIALSPAHLQSLYSEKLSSLSPGSVRQIHAVAGRALSQAKRWRLIDYNPAEDADAPKLPEREPRTLELEDAARLLRSIHAWREDRYALFVLAITTGMRQGEIIGLWWEDIDLESGTVHVRRTLDTYSGPPSYRVPKGGKARRVSLSRAAVEALRNHRRSQVEARMKASKWQDDALVFTGPTGGPIRRANLHQSFVRLLKREGFPAITFHQLRHTFCSLLIEDGVDPKTLQQMLGHADLKITLGVYSRVSARMERGAANAMDRLFDELG